MSRLDLERRNLLRCCRRITVESAPVLGITSMVPDTPACVTTTLMVGEGVSLSRAVDLTHLTLLVCCFGGLHYVEGGAWFFLRLWNSSL